MQNIKIALILGLLGCLFAVTYKTANADFLPDTDKNVAGYVKIEGWENVADYLMVQPTRDWKYCETDPSYNTEFVLLNDGHMTAFGFEAHSSAYYGITAINKMYLEDVQAVQTNTDNPKQNTYTVSCNSDAYKYAVHSTKEIPHGDLILKIDDPIQRVDYTVKWIDIDLEQKSLNFEVSSPINRLSATSPEAILFEDQMVITQKIDTQLTDCSTMVKELNSAIETCTRAKTAAVEPTLVEPARLDSVVYMAGGSLALVSGILGFFIGKKQRVQTPINSINE
ncbi:hypothetical protein KAZ57_01095 [Patescibacteria group bacterium]|nr:hypothetical protein [Patescibacteria group bacterium]